MRKRILPVLLALCMVLARLPGTVWAATLSLPTYAGKVSMGSGNVSFAVDASGTLWGWGSNNVLIFEDGSRESLVPQKIMSGVSEVSVMDSYGVAYTTVAVVRTDGDLWTWGRGLLGIANTTETSTPQKIMEDVVSVTIGATHAAAIKKDGSLWMWGDNNHGQLGNGERSYGVKSSSDVPIKIMDDVVSVSLGTYHTAALKSDGSLWVWGDNYEGQVGNGGKYNEQFMEDGLVYKLQTVPVKIMENVTAISAKGDVTAAVQDNNSLWMWGFNDNRVIKQDSSVSCPEPVLVMGNVSIVSVSNPTIAVIRNDGSLWTWGYNIYGLGDDAVSVSAPVEAPIKVMDNTDFVTVDSGIIAVVQGDGSLWLWGNNMSGQIGTGDRVTQYTPAYIMNLGKDTPLPPTAPIISLTTSTTIDASTSTTVRWDPVQGADHYLLNVVTKGVYLDKDTPISEYQKELQFDTAGEYEIWVQAENATGKSTESNHIIVTVVDGAGDTDPEKTHTLSYDLNGGVGNIPTMRAYRVGETVEITTIVPSRSGYHFAGWRDSFVIYKSGDAFPMPDYDMILVAEWEEKPAVDNNMAYVESLTRYSLANADKETRETLNNAIYNLLFVAQFRPDTNSVDNIDFGSSNPLKSQKDVLYNAWPARNDQSKVSKITDIKLSLSPFTMSSACKGCYLYSNFVSKYVWGTCSGWTKYKPNGIADSTDTTTKAYQLKTMIESYADPGEHIRINNKHSISFIGETSDRTGFYGLEYVEDTVNGNLIPHIKFQHFTYLQLAEKYKGYDIFMYDANNGSYYSNSNETTTAEATRVKNNAERSVFRLECPIEVLFKLKGEILDSRSVPQDGDKISSSFGEVKRDGDALVFTVDYSEDYEIEIVGTGEGNMNLTLGHYGDTGLQNLINSRRFVSVPITSETIIRAISSDVLGSFVLFVYPDGFAGGEVTWGAGTDEIVYGPDSSYSSNYHEDSGLDTSDTPSTPGGGWYPGGGSSGDNSTPSNPNYQITTSTTSNGTVTVSLKSAKSGDKVTITATPNDNYITGSITVVDRDGKGISVADNGDGTYTFTMPASQVTVSVVFTAVETSAPAMNVPDETPWVNLFADVLAGEWYYDAVKFVSENSLMNGTGNNLFEPNANLSRDMLAQILYNKEGQPAVTGSGTFTDVSSDAWYADAVNWAAMNGIVGGYGNGLFGPNDNITREQLAVMLWRYAGEPASNAEVTFNDAGQISDFAQSAIRWTVGNGILNGKSGNILDPKGFATRAEVAQMLKNYLDI